MSPIAITERAKIAVELGESHFREFKSALEGEPDNKKKRAIKDISTNIAQTLVAFANADGGELLVGVEDSGAITGVSNFTEKELLLLEEAPVSRVHSDTPLQGVRKHRIQIEDKKILYFSVPKSSDYVHVTSDGRCLQRRDLESSPVAAEAVQFDRQEKKSREYDREFVDGVTADDLDLDFVQAVAEQVMKGMSSEKCLQYLELAEYGLSQLKYKRAALLLFSKTPSKWHPRLQIRILKVDGDAIGTGEDYNVISDEVINGNILTLVESAWDALRPHLVHTRFDKSARFEQRSIYPELACKEALLNAIAHRDYSDEGRGIEVFIFNDHLEIRNPGSLLQSVRLEDIESNKGVHQSRNSNIARVLRELGYMRELGEGMRRIYNLMHQNELAPPKLRNASDGFSITLTHRALYSEKDLLWLSQYEQYHLDREQRAVVLLGQGERLFSAQHVWDAVGIVDTEHYRKLVDSLLRLDILKNKIERRRAQNMARSKRIPYREFPRYGIGLPSQSKNLVRPKTEPEDIRDDSKRLFIGNLPYSCKKNILYDELSKFGDIAELTLAMHGNRCKGFGFVEFSNPEGMEAALAAENIEFKGRNLALRLAYAKPAK